MPVTISDEAAEELQAILLRAYYKWAQEYQKGERDYSTQQALERLGYSLGIRMTAYNKGDNTYSVSDSPCDPDLPYTPPPEQPLAPKPARGWAVRVMDMIFGPVKK